MIEGFDGIRALGALVIVFYHYGMVAGLLEGHMYPLDDTFIRYIYIYGYLAVELFFIMSGFVIEHNYADRMAELSFGQFMKKRVIRLYPLLLFTTVLVGVEQLIHFEITGEFFSHPVSLYGFILTIFGMQNVGMSELTFNGPLWQVGVLVLMYALYYRSHRSKNRILFCAACILLGAIFISYGYVAPFMRPEFGRGLFSFFVGVLLCRYRAIFDHIKGLTWGLLIVSIFLMVRFGVVIVGSIQLVFGALIFPCILICLLTCKPLAKFFSARPFVYLGNISYGVYAWHFPLLTLAVILYRGQLVSGLKLYKIEFLLGWIVASFVTAAISNKFLEPKLEANLKSFVNRIEASIR